MKRTALKRRTRLRAKGRSRFPRRRDPEFMAWCAALILAGVPCDCGCGRRAEQRSHRISRGAGGVDRGNVNLLALACHDLLHRAGEREFEAIRHCYPGQLADRAAQLDRDYAAEVAT